MKSWKNWPIWSCDGGCRCPSFIDRSSSKRSCRGSGPRLRDFSLTRRWVSAAMPRHCSRPVRTARSSASTATRKPSRSPGNGSNGSRPGSPSFGVPSTACPKFSRPPASLRRRRFSPISDVRRCSWTAPAAGSRSWSTGPSTCGWVLRDRRPPIWSIPEARRN